MVIPARSGSRRLKDKNILDLGGKPLLAWTWQAAMQAKNNLATSDVKIILSTDSEEYIKALLEHRMKEGRVTRTKEEAEPYGDKMWWADWRAEHAPFIRPPELSEDVDSGLVVKHAWDWFAYHKNWFADITILLQPTSPFRWGSHILDVITLLHRDVIHKPELDSVFTVKPVKEFPQWMFLEDPIKIKEYVPPHKEVVIGHHAKTWLGFPLKYLSGFIAQEIPSLFIPNGAVYGMKKDVVKAGRIYGDKAGFVVMDEMHSLDIEEQEDLDYARFLVDTGRMP